MGLEECTMAELLSAVLRGWEHEIQVPELDVALNPLASGKVCDCSRSRRSAMTAGAWSQQKRNQGSGILRRRRLRHQWNHNHLDVVAS